MSPSSHSHKKKNSYTEEQLQNLIGRPLVPFFIEGNNGSTVENATLALDKNQQSYEFDNPLTVREFKDGYFQNAKVVRASSLPTSPVKPVRRGNRQNKHAGTGVLMHNKTPNKAKPASRKGGAKQTHWAGGAYLNSPSPKLVPLPAFVGSKGQNQNDPRAANANANTSNKDSPPLHKTNKNKNKNKITTQAKPPLAPQGGTAINQNVLSFFDAYNSSINSPADAFTTPKATATSASAGASPLLLGTPAPAARTSAARSLGSLQLEDAGSFLLKLVKGEVEVPPPVESSLSLTQALVAEVEAAPLPSPMLFFRGSHGVTTIPIAATS